MCHEHLTKQPARRWVGLLPLLAVAAAVAACSDTNGLRAPNGGPGGPSFTLGPPVSGAIFTTNSTCTGVNLNIYDDKGDVYIDGGPTHAGAAGLPDGDYYVQVTDPSGAPVLGTSVGSGTPTPVHVISGEFTACLQLSAILIKGSDGTPGYDDTSNPGDEYKVWVSNVSTFDNNSTKTDNFKVKQGGGVTPRGLLTVRKFYDANANGQFDGTEQLINGWRVRVQDGYDIIRFTPVSITVEAGDYTVTESDPLETNWLHTTLNPVPVSVPENGTGAVEFGNVCLGAGGGLTLGFWSNNNGRALFNSSDLAALVAANLRNANGSPFDPASYATFRTWLLNATATNMAYMLSAQFAAMTLNVRHGLNAGALVYAPGTTSANSLGFATIAALLTEANAELALHGTTLSGSAFRSYQEALKNALDKANNNLTFVQAQPCAFTFAQ